VHLLRGVPTNGKLLFHGKSDNTSGHGRRKSERMSVGQASGVGISISAICAHYDEMRGPRQRGTVL
jgi:hypothetical protein